MASFKSNCNSIDWKRVSDRVQLLMHDHEERKEALELLDTVSDIINNYDDIKAVNGSHTVDWFNSDDIRWIFQHVIPSRMECWHNQSFLHALDFVCRHIPQCQHDDESITAELERRKTNPYPGCYGYTYVYGVH